QKGLLGRADDYLHAASQLKSSSTKESPKPYQLLFENAAALLGSLRSESPGYVPIYDRLARAYDDLDRHVDAYDFYCRYLEAYRQFDLPFGDRQHEAQRLKAECEGILTLAADSVLVRSFGNITRFIAHAEPDKDKKELAVLVTAQSPPALTPAKLVKIQGIGDQTGISFASAKNLNYYLRPFA